MIVQMTPIQDASTKDLDHLHPDGTVSLLMPRLTGYGYKTDKNGWVLAYFSASNWHACNDKCAKSGLHNLVHYIDAVGYLLRFGKRIPVRITNFDAGSRRGTMELQEEA